MKNLFILVIAVIAITFGWIEVPDHVKKSALSLFNLAKKVDVSISLKK